MISSGSLLAPFRLRACFGFFTLSLFGIRASPVVGHMPTATFKDNRHGSEQFASGSPTFIAFDFRSLIYPVKDLKGVPASVTVVIVNRLPNLTSVESLGFRGFAEGKIMARRTKGETTNSDDP